MTIKLIILLACTLVGACTSLYKEEDGSLDLWDSSEYSETLLESSTSKINYSLADYIKELINVAKNNKVNIKIKPNGLIKIYLNDVHNSALVGWIGFERMYNGKTFITLNSIKAYGNSQTSRLNEAMASETFSSAFKILQSWANESHLSLLAKQDN